MINWAKHREEIAIPDWDEYFMSLALVAASRSPDAQSQYGAVIVKDKHPVGFGYNGYPPGLPDETLPNIRPHKYLWIRGPYHSERNAIRNRTVKSLDGAICYVNGHPCNDCLVALYGEGIREIVILDHTAHMISMLSEEEKQFRQDFLAITKVTIRPITLTGSSFDRAKTIWEKSRVST